MTQPPPPAPDRDSPREDALEFRGRAAEFYRKPQKHWHLVFLFAVSCLFLTATALMVLLIAGKLKIDLTAQECAFVTVFIVIIGMVLYLCRDELYRLRRIDSTNLTALHEADALQTVRTIALTGGTKETMGAMMDAGVALARGHTVPSGTSNQQIELARMEGQQAPQPPDTAMSPAALLVKAITDRPQLHHEKDEVRATSAAH